MTVWNPDNTIRDSKNFACPQKAKMGPYCQLPAGTHKITATVVDKEGGCTAGLKVGDKVVFRVPRIVEE